MPTDLVIVRAIRSTWCLNVRCLPKMISKNILLLVSSIVADQILILVKCYSFLYGKIIYFVLSALTIIKNKALININKCQHEPAGGRGGSVCACELMSSWLK